MPASEPIATHGSPAASEARDAPAASESPTVNEEVPAVSEVLEAPTAGEAHDVPQQDKLAGHVLVAEDNAVNRVLIHLPKRVRLEP